MDEFPIGSKVWVVVMGEGWYTAYRHQRYVSLRVCGVVPYSEQQQLRLRADGGLLRHTLIRCNYWQYVHKTKDGLHREARFAGSLRSDEIEAADRWPTFTSDRLIWSIGLFAAVIHMRNTSCPHSPSAATPG